MSVAASQHRLGRALAAYLVVVIGVVTLAPLQFRWPEAFHLTGFTTVSDLVENVALFVPLGFFLAFGRSPRPALAGLGLSLLVETIQQFIPGRFTSPLDVVTNFGGAWIGAWSFDLVSRSLSGAQRRIGVMALDLPLMGLVYLLLPLLWLSGLAAGPDPGRRWLVALPGLTMAVVVASVSRHTLLPRGVPTVVTAFGAGAGMVVALVPGWFTDPLFIVSAAGAVVVGIIVFGDLLSRGESLGRRFELPTVQRALAPFAVYLLLASLWPLPFRSVAWHGTLGFDEAMMQLGRIGILRVLEMLAGATVVGYALAELRGRREEPVGVRRAMAAVNALGLAVLLAGLRGWHPRYGASLAEAALVAVATWFGAVLYWRQRAYVQAVVLADAASTELPRSVYSRIGAVPLGDGVP